MYQSAIMQCGHPFVKPNSEAVISGSKVTRNNGKGVVLHCVLRFINSELMRYGSARLHGRSVRLFSPRPHFYTNFPLDEQKRNIEVGAEQGRSWGKGQRTREVLVALSLSHPPLSLI
jgi:hypothetical protein